MFRKVAVLLGSLVALSACGYSLRARIVPHSGPVTGQCLDGSTPATPPVERICQAPSERIRSERERERRERSARIEVQSSLRPGLFDELRVAEARRRDALLLPSSLKSPGRSSDADDRPVSSSLAQRMAAREHFAPNIAMPRVIDLSDIRSALRGSVE